MIDILKVKTVEIAVQHKFDVRGYPMKEEIGKKINELRTSKRLTLKELSEKTNLSVSFLSQAERGLTSVAFVSLKRIGEAMGVNINYFFTPPKSHRATIMRSYEQEIFKMEESKFVYYNMGSDIPDKVMDPMLVTILPSKCLSEVLPMTHEGEEFVYVLEGIFTLILDDQAYELHAGDSSHVSSVIPHNWANLTDKPIRIIAVSTPSTF